MIKDPIIGFPPALHQRGHYDVLEMDIGSILISSIYHMRKKSTDHARRPLIEDFRGCNVVSEGDGVELMAVGINGFNE